ncbi:glycine/betaine ABC transporter [Chromatiales bacterium (ex Bugula neritina AB1)]|nr:glycine/betaine ABC transporter [Chromatiales bacterium (ex Bugula neritina AB1)]
MNRTTDYLSNDSEEENYPELIREFVTTNPQYYQSRFEKIGASTGFSWTFNLSAALLGPIWYGMRSLWSWGLPFLLLEIFAFIQIARGAFGNMAAGAMSRITQIEGTLEFRRKQLAAAVEKQADNVAVFERAIASLETAIIDIQAEAAAAAASAPRIVMAGFSMLLVVKLIEGILANPILERRYFNWLSNRQISSGLNSLRTSVSAGFVALVTTVSVLGFAFPNRFKSLSEFPTTDNVRLTAISWVEKLFNVMTEKGDWIFTIITRGIRWVLDSLELVFVGTPWIVVASFIILLTALSAGRRAAIFAAAFLAYMGFLGFWEKAMTTLALLGTAAVLSILIGIPLGLFCARRPRLYSVIRPIMDFMQTMPAFVFMIPVIAFFGTGKPAAVVTTMIFGGTPVVRFTVLGLRGVPESIREAAIAYGASKWYLLKKVDLPLAAPSILAGINQTIMLSLAMVVVASLIGAKGLGEDVLEALQYASVGQGILAGFAILFCAMILDRVVQGKR